MAENDRLISKIEKLVEIFGSNVDSEMLKYSANNSGDAPTEKGKLEDRHNKLLSSTRLLLISRRSNPRLDEDSSNGDQKEDPSSQEANAIQDIRKKKTIDRSIADMPGFSSKEHDQKKQLRQDLDRLDEEIANLKVSNTRQ